MFKGMVRIDDILDRVLSYYPQADISLIRRAYVYASKVHRNQFRQSGEPYLIHPMEVANILADLKLDAVTVAVGLLHDTVEDTLTTHEQIEALFGEEIRHLVDAPVVLVATSIKDRQECPEDRLAPIRQAGDIFHQDYEGLEDPDKMDEA